MKYDLIILLIIFLLIIGSAVVGIILINKKHKLRLWMKIVFPISFILVFSISTMFIYLNIYYHATSDVKPYLKSSELVEVRSRERCYVFDNVSNTETAIVFYGGAKVEEKSYVPLLYKIAEQGVDVYLVKMPFRFAIFDVSAADSILDNKSYTNTYLMGHSLGGVAASLCLVRTNLDYKGIIFLAAYPSQKLSNKYQALSIYGSKDSVLNMTMYKNHSSYFPKGYKNHVIKGGNHANYGYYGKQLGDQDSSISRKDQIDLTVSYIADFINQ